MKDILDPRRAVSWANDAWIIRALIDQFDQCVYLLDAEGRCRAVNAAFRRWLGRSETELLGQTVFDFWPPDLAQRETEQHQQVLSGTWIETEEVRPRGAVVRQVRLRLSPLRDDSGTIRGLICLFRETTEGAGLVPTLALVSPLVVFPKREASGLGAAQRTILLVEPNASVRLLVAAILGQQGFRVLSAKDGLRALEIYHEKYAQIDAILVEMDLPGPSGMEIVSELWHIHPQARILLVNGIGMPGSSWWTEILGLRCLSKPYTPDQLLNAIYTLFAAPLGGER